MRIGQIITVDGWRTAVVCDVRPTGEYYAMSGDNRREHFRPDDSRVTTK